MSLGNLFGGGKQTQTTTNKTEPWGPQQPALQYGFDQARQIYDQRMADPGYQGGFVAPNNDIQEATANNANAYANGTGLSLPYTTANTALTLQGGAENYLANALRLASGNATNGDPRMAAVMRGYATGAVPISGVSSPLSSALESAALSGANGIAAGQNTLAAAQQRALADPTGSTVAAANTYANSPAVDAMVTAASRPILETLNESTVPGLNRAATMGGNLNSSRAGMAEAMANRDAASRLADVEATIRGNAYQNGLNLATQQREAGTNAAIAAASAGASTGTAAGLGVGNQQLQQGQNAAQMRLEAASDAAGQTLARDALNAQTQLGANAQVGSGVNTGIGAGNAAGTQAGQNFALGSAAGGLMQQGDQNALNDAYQRWLYGDQRAAQALKDYWGVIGSGNWGSTSTGTTTTQGGSNPIGGLLGTALGIGSMFATGGMFGPSGAFPGVGSAIGGLFGGGGAAATPGQLVTQGMNSMPWIPY